MITQRSTLAQLHALISAELFGHWGPSTPTPGGATQCFQDGLVETSIRGVTLTEEGTARLSAAIAGFEANEHTSCVDAITEARGNG